VEADGVSGGKRASTPYMWLLTISGRPRGGGMDRTSLEFFSSLLELLLSKSRRGLPTIIPFIVYIGMVVKWGVCD